VALRRTAEVVIVHVLIGVVSLVAVHELVDVAVELVDVAVAVGALLVDDARGGALVDNERLVCKVVGGLEVVGAREVALTGAADVVVAVWSSRIATSDVDGGVVGQSPAQHAGPDVYLVASVYPGVQSTAAFIQHARWQLLDGNSRYTKKSQPGVARQAAWHSPALVCSTSSEMRGWLSHQSLESVQFKQAGPACKPTINALSQDPAALLP